MAAQKRMELERRIKSGIGWFFWIAGLSLVNSVLFLVGSDTSFVIGLGFTQLIDVLAVMISEEVPSNLAAFVRFIGYGLDLALIVAFILFGIFGRKRVRWVIITGMVLYALDAILVLAFGIWFSLAFHLLALWGLWTGLRAIKQLADLDASIPAKIPSVIQEPPKPINWPRL